uniref:Calpain catalytic domain-containing protein n=1 Tax=Scophthalmus maximus TaxID=52904 RepID=A0A8D3BBX5_SCOMX
VTRYPRPNAFVASSSIILSMRPQFTKGTSCYDCWLLSAIASLAMHSSLLIKVMPPGQSFQDGYNGSFTFRFWQYGLWEEVRIDDLLPTRDNKLLFLSSPDKQEFWSSLLEKAYAKLKGGYRSLDMGFPHEAMVDMTGGVAEVLKIASLPRDLPTFLRYLLSKGALINCFNCQGPLEKRNELGIMYRHAYSLTAVEKVKMTHGTKDLVRILNPWGKTEWLGAWSDVTGPEWEKVSAKEQKRLQRVRREDGEFWMSVSDFRQQFELMEVCHLTSSLPKWGSSVLPWSCIMLHGNWVPSITAGGSPLGEVDGGNDKKTCSFVLALMQKHHRRRGIDMAIALHIYPALRPVLCTPHYSSRREVVLRGSLPPGSYIIIPSTIEPNQQGAFLLRVLTEQGNALSYPHEAALPSPRSTRRLFDRHCNKVSFTCTHLLVVNVKIPTDVFYLSSSVLAGSEKNLALEHCKSLVVLMDDIFLVFDKNKTRRLEYQEVTPALKAAGITVDDLVMQLVGLRYTEPDMTISYPGFLYLVMKLESMIRKGGGRGRGQKTHGTLSRSFFKCRALLLY